MSSRLGTGSTWRRLLSRPAFALGLVVVGTVALAALVSFVWTPYDIARISVSARFAGLGAPDHPLGTDQLGRDTLSMLMVGARTSIAVALAAVVIGMGVGVPLGAWAAARGGWVDEAIMRGNDLVFAFPALLSALMIAAAFGASATNAVIAIAIFNVPVFARVARGAALPVWRTEYAMAARAAGKGMVRITLEHVLPNIAALLVVQATIQFSVGIIQEAGLSYIGLGAQSPNTSWGRMLAEAQTLMIMAPRLALLPGLAIVVTVLALNLMGDALRDALDPQLNGGRAEDGFANADTAVLP